MESLPFGDSVNEDDCYRSVEYSFVYRYMNLAMVTFGMTWCTNEDLRPGSVSL